MPAHSADLAFDPSLNASYYWDGNVNIVDPDGTARSDQAIRLSLTLPITVRQPIWSFRTSYTVAGRLYNESAASNDVSHRLTLGYTRSLGEGNSLNASASASRTEDQRIESDEPDRPITFVPRTARTVVNASVSGGRDVSARSDLTWSVSGGTTIYEGGGSIPYEDYLAGSTTLGWSYRISEQTSSGLSYRYGRSAYDTRPDAQGHTVAYTGGTTTRRKVGVSYALGIVATDTGDETGWYTNGGASLAFRFNPRPDHSLSAGFRQDVSPGRGVGGPTLDRGIYVGWAWSDIRGLGVSVTGGYWDRDGVEGGGGNATRSIYLLESLSWGWEYLRIGIFHSYRDQADERENSNGPTFTTSYHVAGITVGWRILGDRGRR